jgi:hypothetical protein
MMAKKQNVAEATETEKTEKTVVETETSATIEVNVPEATDELVMEASVETEEIPANDQNDEIVPEEDKKEEVKEPKEEPKKAPEYVPSTYVVLTNTSQNRLSLVEGDVTINIEPREIKTVRRDDLRAVIRNRVIQNWFDKGILSSNIDAVDQSVHEAVAPDNLTNPVERHDDGMNISASVKKFEKAGTVDINLI